MQLARMIIIDELPFQHVEGKGFQTYSKCLEPRYDIPSHHIVAKYVFKMHGMEKKLVIKELVGQRVCLTIDTYTSIQNFNYMCLTLHYIDCDWKLSKIIINFCQIINHKGEIIAKAFETCIKE